jgi:alpha-1,6-mannosyltransferase
LRLVPNTQASRLARAVVGVALLWVGLAALRWFERTEQRNVTRLQRASLILQLCALPALALTSSDIFSNLAYAALSALGKNPCLLGPSALGQGPVLALVSPRWVDTPSAYGPLLNLLGWLAGQIGRLLDSPVWGAGAAYKLLMAAATAGAIVCAAKTARALGTRVAAQGFTVVALSPLLAWELTAQGHNDAVMVCALCAFAWAAARGKDGLGALALGVGVLAKAGIAPLLLLWLVVMWRRSPRHAFGWAVALAALAVLAWAPFWAGSETLRGVGATAGADLDRHANSLQDLLFLILTPLWPAVKAPLFRSFQIASFAVLGAGTLWAAVKVSDAAGLARAGIVILLGYFLTTPWFQPWYATWLLPLCLLERDPRWQRLVARYAVISVVQYAVRLDPFTTVIGNLWIACQWWRLWRGANGSVQEIETGAA